MKASVHITVTYKQLIAQVIIGFNSAMTMTSISQIVVFATIALASGRQIKNFGQNTVQFPPPGNIKDRIKVQPPPMPSFNIKIVSIYFIIF